MEPQRPPGGRIVLDAPPTLPEATPVNLVARLMPVAMIAAVVGMSALYLRSGASTPRSPMFLALPVMMLVSLIGMLAHGGRGGARTVEINAHRGDYLRYLDTVDAALQAGAAAQHRWLYRHHPGPDALWSLVGTEQMWDRHTAHPEFLCVRVGIGDADPLTSVVLPELPADEDADPVTAAAVRTLTGNRSSIPEMPVLVSLQQIRMVTVVGDPSDCRAVARALVCQLAVTHSPTLLGIAIHRDRDAEWDWLKWLPHIRAGDAPRHRVIVADGAPPPVADGVTVVCVRAARSPVVVAADGAEVAARYDALSLPEAMACARRVARCSPSRASSRRDGWPALMGIADPGAFAPTARWWGRPGARRGPRGGGGGGGGAAPPPPPPPLPPGLPHPPPPPPAALRVRTRVGRAASGRAATPWPRGRGA